MRQGSRPPRRWNEQFHEELRERHYPGQTDLMDALEEMQQHWCDNATSVKVKRCSLWPQPAPDGVECHGWARHADGAICHDCTTRLRR